MNKLEEKLGQSFYPDQCGSAIECVTKKDAIKAIEEYAKDFAKDFDVWKHEKLYEQIGDKFYRSRLTGERITFDQLLSLYEEHLK